MATARELNLSILLAEYRYSKAAENGYHLLDDLITKGDRTQLRLLLRYYRPLDRADSPDPKLRDINQLINAYMVIMVAILAGKISVELPSTLAAEIEMILGNREVVRYYADRNRLALLHLLHATVTDRGTRERVMSLKSDPKDRGLFDEFIVLDRLIQGDDDLDSFLRVIRTHRYSLRDFMELFQSLRDFEKLQVQLSTEHDNKDTTGNPARGLLKFTGVMEEYQLLLRSARGNPLLASAFWHKQGYWFHTLDWQFSSRLQLLFEGLYMAVNRAEVKIDKELEGELPADDLKSHVRKTVIAAIANADFVLQEEWGTPLLNFMSKRRPSGPEGEGNQSDKDLPEAPLDLDLG